MEANFHEVEQQKLHEIARENQYEVLTLVLRGDEEVLYQRYLHRMNEEQRHPVHLSTTLHIREDFLRIARYIRNEVVIGKVIVIEASDFGYQRDEELLKKIDAFMDFSCL